MLDGRINDSPRYYSFFGLVTELNLEASNLKEKNRLDYVQAVCHILHLRYGGLSRRHFKDSIAS